MLRDVESALLSRIIIRFIKENTACDYDRIHIMEAVNLVRNGVTGSKLQLSENVFLQISYDKLIITDNKVKVISDIIQVTDFGEYNLGLYTVKVCEGYNENKQNLIDFSKLSFPFELRTPREGDRFLIPSVGTKAVNRLLTDRKIPKNLRGQLPVIVKDSQVVWINRVGASENFKINNNTNKYIHIIIKENFL